jgi:hypothetical protein
MIGVLAGAFLFLWCWVGESIKGLKIRIEELEKQTKENK